MIENNPIELEDSPPQVTDIADIKWVENPGCGDSRSEVHLTLSTAHRISVFLAGPSANLTSNVTLYKLDFTGDTITVTGVEDAKNTTIFQHQVCPKICYITITGNMTWLRESILKSQHRAFNNPWSFRSKALAIRDKILANVQAWFRAEDT